MLWTILRFGKHRGQTLPQVLFHDPDWFFWAWENHVFDRRGPALKAEADELCLRATRIKPPPKEGEPTRVVEYALLDGKVRGFEIVPEGRGAHRGGAPTFRRRVIDLSLAHQYAPYDKLGGEILVALLKECLFGSRSVRMTRDRCEQFFEDDRHFDQGPEVRSECDLRHPFCRAVQVAEVASGAKAATAPVPC
jgi:hypothetical protein